MTSHQHTPNMGGDLAPCPFCGEKPEHRDFQGNGFTLARVRWTQVVCRSCRIETEPMQPFDIDRAIAAWNRRASPLPSEQQGGEEAKPVAWRYSTGDGWAITTDRDRAYREHDARNLVEPLYAHPAPSLQRSEGLVELRRKLANLELPQMGTDNLAIALATYFDDGEEPDKHPAWSNAAIDGAEALMDAIHALYAASLTAMTEERDEANDRGRRDMLNALLSLNPEVARKLHEIKADPEPFSNTLGQLPFDVVFWICAVADQLGIKSKEELEEADRAALEGAHNG